MKKIIYNGNVIVDGNTSYDCGYVIIEQDKIIEVGNDCAKLKDLNQKDYEWIDALHNYIMPGFIDIHTHGAMGKDFIEGSQEAVDVAALNFVEDGCTAFMASLVVLSHQNMLKVLDGYANIKDNKLGAHFLGVHEEGPYLSYEYKAVMDGQYLRDPSIQELDDMIEHSHNRIKIMTIAPEREGMDEFIPYANRKGITLMIGHTASNPQLVHQAVSNGAKGFTHLYNAMTQHLHREPGCVTGAMIETNTYVELICDGFHVHNDVLLATYKQFGAKRIVMITDASLTKGMPDGTYVFSNLCCEKKGKFVRVKETGRIAGSAYGMIDMVKNMRMICQCEMCDIVQMACVNPSKVAKVDGSKGTLTEGKDADIVLINNEMEVIKVLVSGNIVYDNK